MYIAPGHGHTTTWYKFWQHFEAFIIPTILYHVQKDPLCMYIASGQEQTSQGQNFDVNRKALPLCPFVASFKNISLKLILYILFNDLIDVYSPRAGADNPLGENLMPMERSYHFAHLLQVSIKSL